MRATTHSSTESTSTGFKLFNIFGNGKNRGSHLQNQFDAIHHALAVIEFDPKGIILTANDNFLKTMGYDLNGITGQHHRMFVDPQTAQSQEYRNFWAELNMGKAQVKEFKRLKNTGEPVWLSASYMPVLNSSGSVAKVIKIAQDATKQKLQSMEHEGQINAIGKSQAVISFKMDGTIITANDNFLKTLDYNISEIQGQHHRIFCEASYSGSSEYRSFWEKLNQGNFDAGEYKRIGKGGKEVWIQATYNPILDLNGKPFKVVKFAINITDKKKVEQNINSILYEITKISETLGSSAEELSAVSHQMGANAEETSVQAGVVSTAADEVSKNIQTVAASTEEMSASIKEIAQNANEAAKVGASAVEVTEQTNRTIGKLDESSAEIGEVVKVITSIAEQTNLLALNATIEAARAGEAGKGFAVVANEVKELANQTSKATEDISGKVQAIQSNTQGAVNAIGEITGIITKINEFQGTIASAVEEQTATTGEIGRNVSDAAVGSKEIASNIDSVASAAQNTTQGATDTRIASEQLSKLAVEMQKLVSQFKNETNGDGVGGSNGKTTPSNQTASVDTK